MRRRHRCLLIVAVVLGVAACKRDTAREETTTGAATVTSAAPQAEATVTRASAVEHLVAARCAREEACGNVGERKAFVDRDACARYAERDAREDVDGTLCPRGVDQVGLTICVGALRGERCRDRLSPIREVEGCAAGRICVQDGARQ